MFEHFDLPTFLMTMSALLVCLTIHEFSHAYSAFRAGDDTAKRMGRVSLNPLDHLDPMGTVMMVLSSLSGFGIGWAKPVPVNPANLRHPRWDNLRVSLWGPLSNLLTAAVVGTFLRFWGNSLGFGPLHEFVIKVVIVSIALALFNLIPVTPLDGSHILSALLPYESARQYDYFMARYGMLIIIGLLVSGALSIIIGPPMMFLLRLFTGL